MSRREQLAWLAGLIDGEGCISLTRRSPQNRARSVNYDYRLILKVTMCDLATIKRCREITGVGTIHTQAVQKKHYSKSYIWFCSTWDAELVIEALLPWFVTKKEEAEVALAFLRLPMAKRGGAKGSSPMSEELLQKREEYWQRLRSLKSRNRATDRKNQNARTLP